LVALAAGLPNDGKPLSGAPAHRLIRMLYLVFAVSKAANEITPCALGKLPWIGWAALLYAKQCQ